ncbi:MAG: YkvA family protein [Bosea sp. (in: a-proteobacteria)]
MAIKTEDGFSREEMDAIRRALRDEERFGARLLKLVGKVFAQIPFAEDALAALACARDPETPRRVRYTLLAALSYFLLPIDVVPDMLPLIGFTDDAAVIAAAIASVAGSINEKHRQAARAMLARLKR